jgi:transcriptional regulator with XRE-family HTH domain
MNELQIGKKIRAFRLQNSLTLQNLAQKTGYTKSCLSMIELGRQSPSIATLGRIAKALEVDIAAFFTPKNPENHISHVRKEDRQIVVRDGTALGYQYEAVAPLKRQKRMEPFIVTNPPHVAEGDWLDHEGEEFIFVFQGEMKFFYGDREYHLKEGDCVYFDSSIRHRAIGVGEGPAKSLVVISQPSYSLGAIL